MLLIKLIIAASENHHDIIGKNGSFRTMYRPTLIIATGPKGVCVFVLVSQTMAVTRGTKWDQCIFYHGVEL